MHLNRRILLTLHALQVILKRRKYHLQVLLYITFKNRRHFDLS
jgi:hypothetical protein